MGKENNIFKEFSIKNGKTTLILVICKQGEDDIFVIRYWHSKYGYYNLSGTVEYAKRYEN